MMRQICQTQESGEVAIMLRKHAARKALGTVCGWEKSISHLGHHLVLKIALCRSKSSKQGNLLPLPNSISSYQTCSFFLVNSRAKTNIYILAICYLCSRLACFWKAWKKNSTHCAIFLVKSVALNEYSVVWSRQQELEPHHLTMCSEKSLTQ